MALANPAASMHEFANGGFETGDLGGWAATVPPGGSAVVTSGFAEYGPSEGAYYALLKTDGPGSYTRIVLGFAGSAGQTVSGAAFFKSADYMPFNDNAWVRLFGPDGETTVFYSDVSIVGNYGSSGWTPFSAVLSSTGDYTLEARVANALDSGFDSHMGLDGVAISSQIVEIDIRPGDSPNNVNTNSEGKVPVAILSSDGFDATTEVDTSSLTFGRTGDEASLAFCNKGQSTKDANHDGLADLVCHFDTATAGFQEGDTAGILKGLLTDGTPIEGSDSVNVVP